MKTYSHAIRIDLLDEKQQKFGTEVASRFTDGSIGFQPCITMPDVYYIRESGTLEVPVRMVSQGNGG